MKISIAECPLPWTGYGRQILVGPFADQYTVVGAAIGRQWWDGEQLVKKYAICCSKRGRRDYVEIVPCKA